MREQIAGGLFGVAVGDALGAAVEFLSQSEIRERYGILTEIVGGGRFDLEPGQVTDDTEMMLAVGEGILVNPESPVKSIGDRFVSWYQSNPKSIGNTVRTSIENYLQLKNWDEAAKQTYKKLKGRTAGNGALMRTLPVTFAYYGDPEQIAQKSRKICRMTHWDMIAEMAGVFYNVLASCLVSEEKNRAWEKTWKWFISYAYQEADAATVELISSLRSAVNCDYEKLQATGFVYDTLFSALWCFYNTDSAEDAIVKAVNLGDDADTVGAVTGGLAGVYYGYGALPKRWLGVLQNKERINNLVEGLVKLQTISLEK